MAQKVATAVLEIKTDVTSTTKGFEDIGKAATKANRTIQQAGTTWSKSFSDFGSHVARVQSLVNDFSGQRVIQEAHAVSKAVQEIGGVSKLSAAQQKQVNSAVTAAIDQYKRLGEVGPKALHDLAAATKAVPPPSTPPPVTPNLDKVTGSLTRANAMLATFGAGLSVGALVSFGKEVLNDADALVKMSDKTGVNIQALQQLQVVGDDAGNTIEEFTGAIGSMEDRLASGDKSALAALKKIGKPIEDIKNLDPANQFYEIAEGIRAVNDPAQQMAIAMDIGGKQMAAVLPSIKAGFQDIRHETVGWSAETAHTLDRLGDEWAKFWRDTKVGGGEALVFLDRVLQESQHAVEDYFDGYSQGAGNAKRSIEDLQKEIDDQVRRMTEALKAPKTPPQMAEPLKASVMDADEALAELDRELAEDKKRLEEAKEAARRLAEQLNEVQRAGYRDSVAMRVMAADLQSIGEKDEGVDQLRRYFDDLDKSIRNTAASIKELGTRWPSDLPKPEDLGGGVLPVTRITVPPFAEMPAAGKKSGLLTANRFVEGFASVANRLPDVVLRAFEGGGNPGGAIGGVIGGSIAEGILGKVGSGGLQDGLNKVLGKTIGGVAGSFVPVIGTILGGLAGDAVGKLIGKLGGGPSKTELEGRKTEKAFQDQFKSFDEMVTKIGAAYLATGKTLEQARADVTALMEAERQGADATQAIVDGLQGALDQAREINDEIHSQGFLSRDELQHAADVAHRAFDQMQASGQYSADQLDKAFRHFMETLAATGDEAAKMWLKVHPEGEGQSLEEQAAAAGFKTRDELAKAADEARALFEYMRSSGKYTADDIAKAFEAATQAQEDAIGIPKKLRDEYKTLSEAVSNEAPEEKVGAIEEAQRKRMAEIKKDLGAAATTLEDIPTKFTNDLGVVIDKTTLKLAGNVEDGLDHGFDAAAVAAATNLADAADAAQRSWQDTSKQINVEMINSVKDAARQITDLINGLSFDPKHIAIEWDVPPLPSSPRLAVGPEGGVVPMAAGDYLQVRRPTLFLAGERGPEHAVFGGAGRNLARDIATELRGVLPEGGTTTASAPTIENYIMLEGRVIPVLTRSIARTIRHDKGGAGTDMRESLRILGMS